MLFSVAHLFHDSFLSVQTTEPRKCRAETVNFMYTVLWNVFRVSEDDNI